MTTRDDELAGLRGEEREAASARRSEIAARHLRPRSDRPVSSARGLHHVALLSSDVERTVKFYQDVLEFPMTEIFENRDYKGSNHSFFDMPGLDLGPYAEVLGGLHHMAISVEPERWRKLRDNLDKAGVPYQEE